MANKKQIKEKDLANMEVVNEEVVNGSTEERTLVLTEQDAQVFLNILGVVLYKDDRLKVVQGHFLDIINNRNNENNREQ